MILGIFGTYWYYRNRYDTFDYPRFEKWRVQFLRNNPDAEQEELIEFRHTQQGAPNGIWLKEKYLRELKRGKVIGVISICVGIILAAIF